MRALIMVVLVAGLTSSARAATRADCEGLEKGGEWSAAAACYLELAEHEPAGELLYAAALCLDRAGSTSQAIRVLDTVVQHFPAGRVAMLALRNLAFLEEGLGDLAQAARHHELYATRYPAELEAEDALRHAVMLRRALGDDARVIDDTHAYVKRYAARRPEEAARAFFSLVSVYDGPRQQEAHLEEYIKRHGSKGGVDLLAIAHARLGALELAASCPVRLFDGGLCLELVRVKSPCSPTPLVVQRVRPRRPRELAAALRELHAALEIWSAGGERRVTGHDEAERQVRIGAAAHALGEARLHLAELELEAALTPGRPVRSEAALVQATRELVPRVARARQALIALLASERYWSVAALARLGQLLEAAAALVAALPDRPTLCEAARAAAGPFAIEAPRAYEECAARATAMDWPSEWSARCHTALSRLEPQQYPPAREIGAAPSSGVVMGVVRLGER